MNIRRTSEFSGMVDKTKWSAVLPHNYQPKCSLLC